MNGLMKLWIIDQDAGISVFDQTFEKSAENMDSDLIGGFFMALLGFSQEIAKTQIQYMQLLPFRIYFYPMTHHVIILATENFVTPEMATNIALKIKNRFELKYKKILAKEFTGNVAIFNDFAQDVEQVLETKCICHKIFQEKSELLQMHYENSKNAWVNLKNQITQHLAKRAQICAGIEQNKKEK